MMSISFAFVTMSVQIWQKSDTAPSGAPDPPKQPHEVEEKNRINTASSFVPIILGVCFVLLDK